MPANAVKTVARTQTTRRRDEGQPKCLASPPQTPAIRLSSRVRAIFMSAIRFSRRSNLPAPESQSKFKRIPDSGRKLAFFVRHLAVAREQIVERNAGPAPNVGR